MWLGDDLLLIDNNLWQMKATERCVILAGASRQPIDINLIKNLFYS
jgi:hypothetical protein